MENKKREDVLKGETVKGKTACGNMYITINVSESGYWEVFPRHGKAGVCINVLMDSLGRMIALALRNGASLSEVINQLRGYVCQNSKEACPSILSKILEKYLEVKNESSN